MDSRGEDFGRFKERIAVERTAAGLRIAVGRAKKTIVAHKKGSIADRPRFIWAHFARTVNVMIIDIKRWRLI